MLCALGNVLSSSKDTIVMGSSSCSMSSQPSSLVVSRGSDRDDESLAPSIGGSSEVAITVLTGIKELEHYPDILEQDLAVLLGQYHR